MLIRAEVAKAAVSFCPYMVHDHYLALYASNKGKIISLPDRLIRYPSSPVSYTHLRAHETEADLVCRLLLEKKIKML